MSDLFKTFKAAVALGRPRLINAIMREPDFDAEDALVWACEHAATNMAIVLLNKRKRLARTVVTDSEPLLTRVVTGNQAKLVKAFLGHGANPNVRDADGFTALMRASGYGYRQVVRQLLTQGADANLQNNAGETALMLASERNHAYVIDLLIEHGAQPNLQDQQGQTALMKAMKHEQGNAYNALMERRAAVNIQDHNGMTALMFAAKEVNTYGAEKLFTFHMNPNLKNNKGETALMIALENDAPSYEHGNFVRLLLKTREWKEMPHKLDLSLTNPAGETAWDIAVRRQLTKVAKLLEPYRQAA